MQIRLKPLNDTVCLCSCDSAKTKRKICRVVCFQPCSCQKFYMLKMFQFCSLFCLSQIKTNWLCFTGLFLWENSFVFAKICWSKKEKRKKKKQRKPVLLQYLHKGYDALRLFLDVLACLYLIYSFKEPLFFFSCICLFSHFLLPAKHFLTQVL